MGEGVIKRNINMQWFSYLNALRAYTATMPMRQNDVPEVSRRGAQVSWNTHGTRGGRKSEGTRGGAQV